MHSQIEHSQIEQSQTVPSQTMQTRSSKATFWNNLIQWAKAFDSTAQYHQYRTDQNQIMKRDSELQGVSGQAGKVKSTVAVRRCFNDFF
jgi:hypothetical protein